VRGRVCARVGQSGYSLYDLMVTLSVAGVISTGAVSTQQFIEENRIRTLVGQLHGDLIFARSEAAKRGAPVTVCKSSDGASCTPLTPWQNGWIVFTDPNDNQVVDPDETVLRVQAPLGQNTTLGLRASGFSANNNVTYQSSGASEKNGTFTFCDARGARKAKAIILTRAGRPRTSTTASDGGPLSCS